MKGDDQKNIVAPVKPPLHSPAKKDFVIRVNTYLDQAYEHIDAKKRPKELQLTYVKSYLGKVKVKGARDPARQDPNAEALRVNWKGFKKLYGEDPEKAEKILQYVVFHEVAHIKDAEDNGFMNFKSTPDYLKDKRADEIVEQYSDINASKMQEVQKGVTREVHRKEIGAKPRDVLQKEAEKIKTGAGDSSRLLEDYEKEAINDPEIQRYYEDFKKVAERAFTTDREYCFQVYMKEGEEKKRLQFGKKDKTLTKYPSQPNTLLYFYAKPRDYPSEFTWHDMATHFWHTKDSIPEHFLIAGEKENTIACYRIKKEKEKFEEASKKAWDYTQGNNTKKDTRAYMRKNKGELIEKKWEIPIEE